MEFKDFAISLAHRAGDVIRNNFTSSAPFDWKPDGTPQTKVDTTVSDLVIAAIKETYPDHSCRTEEGSFTVPAAEYIWLCDPLNGTIPFAHGAPTCAFSLALVHNKQSILGVVYDPFLDRLYYAERGKGSWLNGIRIHVSTNQTLENSVVGIAFWKGAQFELLHLLNRLKQTKAKTLDLGSSAYMGALVAEGRFAAVITPTAAPFDPAAIKVIVEEAGGMVTDLFGQNQTYDKDIRGHLVSNGILHTELVTMINASVK